MEELIREAEKVLPVSFEAAEEYEKHKDLMLNFVNTKMSKRKDIFSLIGGNSLQMMFDNHRHHVNFMINVFKFSMFELLVRMVPWVYRSYHNHGFTYDYFLVELETWKKAIKKFLSKPSSDEIMKTYDWLIEKHEKMIDLSKDEAVFTIKLEGEWEEKKNQFLYYILEGDFEKALKFTKKIVKRPEDLQDFYLNIIQPALYDVGNLWEQGKISVAEEHLATSIVGRIIANLYLLFSKTQKSKLKAIVTATPNEFHELGCRMVADFLEMDGWDVLYLGANVPEEELINIVKKTKPKLLAISVTMPFNITKAQRIIESLKTLGDHVPKIMVGGIAFNLMPDLYKKIGADFWAKDAKEAVEVARKIKTL
ncbi:cobalamin B12-binding domain-containing protein [Thermodesulfobacterium commune]|uniref:cobalamin B12-binding domain-containing protein n=1 Tax=Thermodesulfobacterium commune TaxID=1741 RepID=UPI002FDB0E0A